MLKQTRESRKRAEDKKNQRTRTTIENICQYGGKSASSVNTIPCN